MKQGYIIRDSRGAVPVYVCARPGWMLCRDGKHRRDGTDPKRSGPEWTERREHALIFRSHRAAARIASKVHKSEILRVDTPLDYDTI
ncbi:MAG: hypothetical protein D6800_00090 [Candidatus Zixiibacteriota bacterium]|nr:MAG: hypothetical protein D6800_00090 [candidate division Zixibacteria bacterium]